MIKKIGVVFLIFFVMFFWGIQISDVEAQRFKVKKCGENFKWESCAVIPDSQQVQHQPRQLSDVLQIFPMLILWFLYIVFMCTLPPIHPWIQGGLWGLIFSGLIFLTGKFWFYSWPLLIIGGPVYVVGWLFVSVYPGNALIFLFITPIAYFGLIHGLWSQRRLGYTWLAFSIFLVSIFLALRHYQVYRSSGF